SQLAKKASYSLAKLKEIEMIEMSRVYRFLAGARLKEEDGLEAVCQKFEADFMVTGSVLEASPGSFEAEASVYGAASGTATKVSFSFTVTNMPEGNILGLEAVYLPVEPPDAENIISHLAFFDLKMTLLGNSKWYNKTFLAGPAKPNLENAVFTAPFFASGSDPLTASFTEEYRAKYYEDPDELASSGFDTAGLVLKALENGAAGKRETEAALNTLDGVPGLNGSYTSLNREFKRKPRLLSVKEGELTEIK
ncbi:MAG: ABC transporter substrate-binding protein, partial [Candidatus Firestonebacteria bacterium]